MAGTFFGKGNFIVLEDNLTFEELRRAVQKANKEFYLRPQYILQSMGSIRSLSDVKYYLSGGLEMIKSIL